MQQIKFVMTMSLANVVRVKSTCLLSDISFVSVGISEEILLCVVACYLVANAPAVGTAGAELGRRALRCQLFVYL